MRKYSDYKDSGIEWMGEIPSHWNMVRMKYLCDIGTGNKDTENAEEGGEYPFFVRSQKEKRISTFTFDGEAILTAGDGDICKIWHYIDGKFDYHQRVYRMSDFNGVIGKYLFYYLKQNFILEVKKLSAKSTVDSLRRPMFQNFQIAFGSIEEQTNIAKFLDGKTAEIDDFIAKKELLIELYKEERTAIINQAVTKGLDPNVPMKDSGIEWLGEIPEHWDVKKLKYIGDCQNGVSAGAEYFGSGHPFVSYGDVYKNEILPNTVAGLAKSNEEEQKRYSIRKGDVLFTRTSETVEEIGIASTCLETIEKATYAGFIIKFRPREGILFEGFSKYFFRSTIHRNFFVKEMNIVTRASLSQELLKRLLVFIPSIHEQIKISNWLDNETKKLSMVISKTLKEIELLKEYKTALISEVVLGKVDVREAELAKI